MKGIKELQRLLIRKRSKVGVVGSRLAWLAGLHNVLGEVLLEEVTLRFNRSSERLP